MRNWFVSHMIMTVDGTKNINDRFMVERHEILGEFETRQKAYLFAKNLSKGSLTFSDKRCCQWEEVIDEGKPASYKLDIIRIMRLE